jgi:hypothetical protein
MSDECVLTAAVLQKAIRALRAADARDARDRCTSCGERRSLHLPVPSHADPWLVERYLRSGGAFCSPGPTGEEDEA